MNRDIIWDIYQASWSILSFIPILPLTLGFMVNIVGSRIEVPCAIRVLEVLKVFSYRFEDAESNERGLTSGKCGELSLEGVFKNGGQNTLNYHYGAWEGPKTKWCLQILFIMMLW